MNVCEIERTDLPSARGQRGDHLVEVLVLVQVDGGEHLVVRHAELLEGVDRQPDQLHLLERHGGRGLQLAGRNRARAHHVRYPGKHNIR